MNDVVSSARFCRARLADGSGCALTGAAGGYTTLAVLTFRAY
jgi:hypothetical protein